MNRLPQLVCVLATCLLVSACAIKSVKQWASNKVTVEVHDSFASPIPDASVETSENQQQALTDQSGRAIIYYQKTGLKVITISAESYETKQIKVIMPNDNNKIVNVTLPKKK